MEQLQNEQGQREGNAGPSTTLRFAQDDAVFSAEQGLVLSVIVPARNEERNLAACLASLVAQSETGWLLGSHWELLVIDDGSTDQTAAIAKGFAGVQVLSAQSPPPKGWTGKSHACWAGAEAAHGRWLLFTDADTVHCYGSCSRAVVEAERHNVEMLSYLPRQVVRGLLQRAVLPLVFSELAIAYPPAEVNDPAKGMAMANGQFLLLQANAYRKTGGHAAVASSLVEEVDLAFRAKREKVPLRFRYAPEAAEAHTSLSFGEMWQGWSRNLALLINNALPLAAWRLLDVMLCWGIFLLAIFYPVPFVWERLALWLLWLRTLWRVYRRAAQSNFSAADVALSLVFGLPLFVTLLYSSWYRVRITHRVLWKGREYPVPTQR